MPGHIRKSTARSRIASVTAAALLLTFLSLTANAQIRLDLPAEPLAQALTTLGSLANLNIYFDPAAVDGIQSPALKAEMRPDDALAKLLAGTRLRAVRVDENTFRVVGEGDSKHAAQGVRNPAIGNVYPPLSAAPVHLASAGATPPSAATDNRPASTPDLNSSGGSSSTGISEVIVSAEKRDERLQDVPVPVSAISASTLLEANQVQLTDYYSRVPALNVAVNEFGAPQLTIRGLTTGGFTSPTVGVVVDDIPFGPSSPLAYGEEAPDLDPSDLQRVEVLRGPQGTLYGASSLGGLLKYVTVDPSTAGLTGSLQAGTDTVHNAANVGYNVRGAINVPLTDTLAVRASAFTRHDPGYIDDPVRHVEGVNEGQSSGARLSALWKPSQDLSLKVSALVQRARLEGSSTVDTQYSLGGPPHPLGDLQQTDAAGSGTYDKKLQAYSAILNAKLGTMTLTSITGYNITGLNDSYDYTPLFGDFTVQLFNGARGTPLFDHLSTRKFTQEIRLAGPAGPLFDWLVGGIYNHEKTTGTEDLLATDYFTGALAGTWAHFIGPNTFSEYAGFANLTFHVTDKFDLELGGRESHNQQNYQETVTGPYALLFNGADPYIYPPSETSENSFTYLFTPRYRFSADLMVYARLASGYRPGGPNTNIALGLPKNYKADKTLNYEIGVKGDALDQLLTFDASVYYIDWKDIQLRLTDPVSGESYFANGSRAKSEGIELSVETRPVTGMTLNGWVTWNDAVLTENFPAASTAAGGAYGASGDRLPYGSRFSGNISFEQEFLLMDKLHGFAGGTVSYVGEREGTFTPTPKRQIFPGYARSDLHIGARYDTWTLNVFVNNVADRRALLGGGLGTYNQYAFTLIQPRTIGLNLSKIF